MTEDGLPEPKRPPLGLSWYSDNLYIRALVQSVPYVGGALDTLLGGPGERWRLERLEHFISTLGQNIKSRIGESEPSLDSVEKEPLFDLVDYTLEQVVKTRSKKKREYFSALLAKQITEKLSWNEAEAAARLLSGLTEAHIVILGAAMNAPRCGSPFEDLKVVSAKQHVTEEGHSQPYPLYLGEIFDNTPTFAIQMVCSELVARGLLQDEGIGRLGTHAMEYFVATEMTQWFFSWIDQEKK